MAKQRYFFEVHTGDQFKAGTDSNIFVILQGEYGESSEFRLNGHIKGNAFERNKKDRFSIELDENYGDIFKITVRSDDKYLGSDWLCNYFKISRHPLKANKNISKFNIHTWFKNTSSKVFPVTSGYNKTISSRKYILEEEGAHHYIAAGSRSTIAISKEVTTEVNYSKVQSASIESRNKVSVPIKTLSADFEINLNSSIENSMSKKLGTTEKFSSSVEYDNSDSNQNVTLQEMWAQDTYGFDCSMGDMDCKFEIPTFARFIGFKNTSTGEILKVEELQPV